MLKAWMRVKGKQGGKGVGEEGKLKVYKLGCIWLKRKIHSVFSTHVDGTVEKGKVGGDHEVR